MRPVSGQPELSRNETAEDVLLRLEVNYTYDRRGERSTMAFVNAYLDELVIEFFDWRSKAYMGELRESLPAWEIQRFGSPLLRGAHWMLLFAVRCNLSLEDGGRKLPYAYTRKSTPPKLTPRDPDRLASQAAKGHEMPHRMGQAGYNRRMDVLREQAVSTREPGGEDEEAEAT